MSATPSTLTASGRAAGALADRSAAALRAQSADAQRRPGGADRGVDGRVRLHQPDPGRRGRRHPRRPWAADGGAAAGPGRGAGGPARASDAGAEAGLCDRRQSTCPARRVERRAARRGAGLAPGRDASISICWASMPSELEQLLAPAEGDTSEAEDEVPEPPVEPISKPGDLWLLGRPPCPVRRRHRAHRRRAGARWLARRHGLDRSALQRRLRQLGQGQAQGQGSADPQRRARRRLRRRSSRTPAPTS